MVRGSFNSYRECSKWNTGMEALLSFWTTQIIHRHTISSRINTPLHHYLSRNPQDFMELRMAPELLAVALDIQNSEAEEVF